MLELEAIKHGLEIAWDFGLRKLWCETHSLEAYNAIISTSNGYPIMVQSLVLHIQALIQKDWDVNIHHVFYIANQAVDFMAKIGARGPKRFRCGPIPLMV